MSDIAWIDGEWHAVENEPDEDPTLNETFNELECNGECLTPYDIGVPGTGIAYPHPACPLHSWSDLLDPFANEEDVAAQRSVGR